ncbi:S41 family peptidase [Roseateles sp. BYS87W]|uniref:S41 family peptidase n=1 Tax=Pelomonas baiyunensis TaxID=3299026 RepID=A0ABW7H0X4_9BURK
MPTPALHCGLRAGASTLAAAMLASIAPIALADPLPPQVTESLRAVASSYQAIQSDYVTPVDGTQLLSACMKGMFKSLDASSAHLDGPALAALTGPRPRDTAGIGVELTQRAGLPTVVSTSPGSPAETAGLRPRDFLLEIDGESLEEADPAQAIARLNGPAGSTVTVTLRRPGESAPRTLSLVRVVGRVPPIVRTRGPDDIGYLRLYSLLEATPGELRREFNALQQGGPLRGLVLDLRRSPGGLLNASIEIAAMFLPPDAVIARSEGRVAEATQTFTANRAEVQKLARTPRQPWPEALTSVPLVVLVDSGTASGAEILAAALRDNGRARLIGSKTFGRGSVQTVRMISPTSAIKLTTALYRTPAGEMLQGRGLAPDEAVPELELFSQAGSANDPALARARALLAARP